ncbi:MAG: hypothetical protein HWD63_04050 [Candidatus Parvibacillus calidus]|nr:MAG: hypothetical protein HWD63_04050 [Candidatus Parvibacillus calidus]
MGIILALWGFHRRCRLNKVLPKWGLMEVIQQGFFYQPFAIFELTVFKCPHFGNTQTVVIDCKGT